MEAITGERCPATKYGSAPGLREFVWRSVVGYLLFHGQATQAAEWNLESTNVLYSRRYNRLIGLAGVPLRDSWFAAMMTNSSELVTSLGVPVLASGQADGPVTILESHYNPGNGGPMTCKLGSSSETMALVWAVGREAWGKRLTSSGKTIGQVIKLTDFSAAWQGGFHCNTADSGLVCVWLGKRGAIYGQVYDEKLLAKGAAFRIASADPNTEGSWVASIGQKGIAIWPEDLSGVGNGPWMLKGQGFDFAGRVIEGTQNLSDPCRPATMLPSLTIAGRDYFVGWSCVTQSPSTDTTVYVRGISHDFELRNQVVIHKTSWLAWPIVRCAYGTCVILLEQVPRIFNNQSEVSAMIFDPGSYGLTTQAWNVSEGLTHHYAVDVVVTSADSFAILFDERQPVLVPPWRQWGHKVFTRVYARSGLITSTDQVLYVLAGVFLGASVVGGCGVRVWRRRRTRGERQRLVEDETS